MRHQFGLAALAVVLLFGSGCGGGSGGSGNVSRTANIQGIWTGTSTSPSGTAVLNVQYTQNGTQLTGVTQLIVGGAVYTGALTGSVNGNNISTVVNYGTFGTANGTLTVNGNTISGTSVRTVNGVVVDTATTNLTKSGLTSTVTLAQNYGGTTTNSKAGSQPIPLSFTVVQTGDLISYTGSSNNQVQLTGSGAVIGNRVTAHLTNVGTSDYTDLTGLLSGTTISGTTYEPGTNIGNNGTARTGTFTLNVVVISTSRHW